MSAMLESRRCKNPRRTLCKCEPSDVLALTLKPSEDGAAWIVRLFGASGESRKAKLTWASPLVGQTWKSNLAEESLSPIEDEISVGGCELLTLRIERKSQ